MVREELAEVAVLIGEQGDPALTEADAEGRVRRPAPIASMNQTPHHPDAFHRLDLCSPKGGQFDVHAIPEQKRRSGQGGS